MSKRNIFLRIGVLMLIATLATSGVFVGSGTYAKYAATKEGSAQARVASFHVFVGGTEFSSSGVTGTEHIITASGPLGPLLQPSASFASHPGGSPPGTMGVPTISAVDGSLIAPGTGGRLYFTFTNTSEVSVRFWLDSVASTVSLGNGLTTNEIKFAVDNSGIPGTFGTSLATALGSYGANYVDLGPASGATSVTRGVFWQWPFDQGTSQNGQDTILGKAAQTLANAGTLTLTLKIRAQQID